jgi:hypothetical protein
MKTLGYVLYFLRLIPFTGLTAGALLGLLDARKPFLSALVALHLCKLDGLHVRESTSCGKACQGELFNYEDSISRGSIRLIS